MSIKATIGVQPLIKMFKSKQLILLLITWAICGGAEWVAGEATAPVTIPETDFELILNENRSIVVHYLKSSVDAEAQLTFVPQHEGLVAIVPSVVEFKETQSEYNVAISGLKLGHVNVEANYTSAKEPNGIHVTFLRITVAISSAITIAGQVVGWIYFVAWSVSFYPQIVTNYQRKSVVGLNFDFLALNIVGFVVYSVFNVGMWIPAVHEEYLRQNPGGLNPIQLNDILFAVHAVIVTLATIAQCFVYERSDQRVSTVARGILGIFGVAVVVFFILVATDTFQWLTFLYACSYIKLTITLIKYIPQALMNYRRKSTVGWSIGNILLDFTGGIFSMLQMILNAYNYDDWNSIFGDPTKFGLGLFSVSFDILFMVQHYILYRNTTYQEIVGENAPARENEEERHVDS